VIAHIEGARDRVDLRAPSITEEIDRSRLRPMSTDGLPLFVGQIQLSASPPPSSRTVIVDD